MKLGVIAPIKLLKALCITNYHYCIPKLITECKEYREFYQSRAQRGNLVVLDCRQLEWRRSPEALEVCKKAAELLNGPLIVLPSIMYNWEKTKLVQEEYSKAFLKSPTIPCVEGSTKEEIKKVLEELRKTGNPNFAIPGHIIPLLDGKDPSNPKGSVFFIENNTSVEEVDKWPGYLFTSLPVRLGLKGKLLSDYRPTPSSLNFYSDDLRFLEVAQRNIEEAINLLE